MTGRRLVALLLVVAAGAGCQVPSAGPPRDLPIKHVSSKLADVSPEFGIKLIDALLQQGDDNVVVSPLSATLMLAMAADAGSPDARNAILSTLGLDPTLEPSDEAKAIIDSLATPSSGATLDIANAAWLQNGLRPAPAYVTLLKNSYKAEVRNTDLTTRQGLDAVNDWVKRKTNQKIAKLFDELPTGTVAVLLNAVYFHADWKLQFDPRQTTSAPFETFDGSTSQVPLMSLVGRFSAHWSPDGVEWIVLPYAGGRYSMALVLPPRRLTAREFASWLTPAIWSSVVSDSEPVEAAVQLPRFKTSGNWDLTDILAGLGMAPAFSSDYPDLCGGCRLAEVRQATYLEVDERGTTAAAATGGAVATSAPPTFRFDRPFLLGLIDNATGSPLFMGVIGRP